MGKIGRRSKHGRTNKKHQKERKVARKDNKRAVDYIREMNPGKRIPPGEELAQELKQKWGK